MKMYKPCWVFPVIASALLVFAAVYPLKEAASADLPACPSEIDFKNSSADELLVSGFSSERESWGRWTEGNGSVIACSLPAREADRPTKIKLATFGYAPKAGKQPVEVSINGTKVGTYDFPHKREAEIEIMIPKIETQDLRITFDIKDPSSPLDNGESGDSRKLGVGFMRMKFLK